MADEQENKNDFSSFLTCREDDDGRLSGFHICGNFDQAIDWREKDIQKNAESKGGQKSKPGK